jgi:hypothetical protein
VIGGAQQSTTTSTQQDTQVTTIVQQLDSQGPAVVERISTQFQDVACTPENARRLVEALHGGTSVTLNSNGQTATFTPTGTLGYGETYVALALAAEALHQAGVTGCATPDQWKAVLMGGPLSGAGTSSSMTSTSSSASSSSNFPGILALHSQGQGWGQVAQATHVQLGQVVSSARTFTNGSTSSSPSSSSWNSQQNSSSNSDTMIGRDRNQDNDQNRDQNNDQHRRRDRNRDRSGSGSQNSDPSSSSNNSGSSSSESSSSSSPTQDR